MSSVSEGEAHETLPLDTDGGKSACDLSTRKMSHRRYGSAGHRSEKTIFNSLHENRGIETFKTALESSPDVLGFLKSVNRQDSKDEFNFQKREKVPNMRGEAPRSSTGHDYGINTRFPTKFESAPGCSVSSLPIQPARGLRFQSRGEKHKESSSPGPQAYLVNVPSNPSLGVMLREPKFREWQESYSSLLGPGSYDIKPRVGAGGHEFSKSASKEDFSEREDSPVPGPGHYAQKSVDSVVSFSIPKSAAPLFLESEKLGPGYYRVADPYKKASVSGRFASAPRFREPHSSVLSSTVSSGYYPRYRNLDPAAKQAQKQRIQANKDTTSSRPEIRLQLIARSSQRHAFQREVARMVKQNLQASVTERRKSALEDKMRKFEMRMRKDELKEVKKVWLAAVTYIGSVIVLKHKFVNRKVRFTQELHKRSQAHLKFLMLNCVALGVVLRKRCFIRKRRALAVLRKLGPHVARWRMRKRREYREVVANFFERAMMQDTIYQLMRRWVRNLLMVQRAVRKFIAERKMMYAALKHTWNLTEAEIHKHLAKTKSLKSELAVEGASSIPDAIKDHYLHGGLQKKFSAYFTEVRKYKQECERLRRIQHDDSLENAARAVMLGVKAEELYYEVPLPPVFSVVLTKSDIKVLILEAETNRVNWDKIMQKGKCVKAAKAGSRDSQRH